MVSRAVVSAPRPPPPASGLRIPFNRRYFPPPRRVLRAGRFQRTDGFVPVPRHDRRASSRTNIFNQAHKSAHASDTYLIHINNLRFLIRYPNRTTCRTWYTRSRHVHSIEHVVHRHCTLSQKKK